MTRQLPPLNGLRAFAVASSTCSLVSAADELDVTPSAVGHQIRALEKILGIRLFDRQGKRLSLTETGRRYAPLLRDAFELVYRATESVRREVAGRPITVSATPAIALRWLAPTLDRLRQESIADFRIDASSRQADLAAGEADLDIRYGLSVEPGLVSEVLFSEIVFPVCHPAYAAERGLHAPSDLLEAELLFVDDWGRRGGVWSAWRDWFATAGLNAGMIAEAARYTEMDKAVAAAASGTGVAIGAARHLEKLPSGRLTQLFGSSLELRYCAFLVALPEVAEEPTIRRLMRRLTAIGAQSQSVLHEGAF
ncbi:MAG: LysR family transcriptional regulator [Mesorhizobium sp.]|uniref:LysR substrate-binding domain-containing protein n=1 Tax=Mesorhizobium sp. TaxID=1871066 RepID=UPI001227E450|nr:LysR substrate-binding domain-containing protein [Mesorhizobium sp.]TIM96864.1 MAG: LysR family transcriptional regulator [Mesorhizobium sp.]